MQNNQGENIYNILGIKPHSPKSQPDKPEEATEKSAQLNEYYANAPSGSIFDRYSTYPKEEQGYWRYFRILTIIGIATCVCLIVACVWGDDISLFSVSHSTHSSYVESTDYEYDSDNATEEESNDLYDSALSVPKGTKYFKGSIDNRYNFHMELDFDNESGRYYYDRSNASNCLKLVISSAIANGDGTCDLVLQEYNPDGDLSGIWHGNYDTNTNTYEGVGVFLGKEMPFNIEMCSYYETDFSNQ